MKIDISSLQSHVVEEITIDGEYILDSSYYENSEIIGIDPIKVVGVIYLKENDIGQEKEYMNCKITGKMRLHDSVSLEEIDYPFSINYDDFLEENTYLKQNILDIFEFLWENILLEVPLHYTEVKDLHKFHGDGWRLIHEDEVDNNNPFRDLLKDIEKE